MLQLLLKSTPSTAQKLKFSLRDFFTRLNVTKSAGNFLNGKFHFLRNDECIWEWCFSYLLLFRICIPLLRVVAIYQCERNGRAYC